MAGLRLPLQLRSGSEHPNSLTWEVGGRSKTAARAGSGLYGLSRRTRPRSDLLKQLSRDVKQPGRDANCLSNPLTCGFASPARYSPVLV